MFASRVLSCLVLCACFLGACGDSSSEPSSSDAGAGGRSSGAAGTSNAGTTSAGSSSAGTNSAGTAGESVAGAGAGASDAGAAGEAGASGACDATSEWWRSYKAASPAACQTVKFACPEHTERFANDCGCGCEQARTCTEVLTCQGDCADEQALCPYSELPR